jgi:uncharacterized membrane protein
MLPDSTVPGSLTGLLTVFRPCFTTPTFSTFSGLVVGLIAQTRRRTVCGMLLGVGLERVWHHARAHRFFATARWCADSVGLVMLDLIVDRLLPAGSAITVVIDDTLFKRAGRKVFGVFWHHDGAAKGPKPIGFGNCWVVAGVVVVVPFLSRPVCLPVLARLWHPRRTGKLAHARVMVELVAARYPDRQVHAVGDAAYVGDHLRGLDKHVTWTSRLKVTSVLHALAPPRTGKSGRPRTKGPGWAPRPTWPPPPAGAKPRFAATVGSTSCGSRRSCVCGTGRFAVRRCGWCWSVTTSPAPGIVMIVVTACRW